MSRITESELEQMSIEEQYKLRRECADNRDIESLLTIVKYHFENGSAATNESNLPEMCYYYGRLNNIEELQEYLQEKNSYLFMLPESCKELAQNLLNIGYKFPNLNESEISYLEEKYCDSKTFELFDIIMFDSDVLPRQIKKLNKESLNKNNTDFSNEFLMEIYNCFLKNDSLDSNYDDYYVYNRIDNNIIRKQYKDTGLVDYIISDPIRSNELWSLMKESFSEECSDYFMQQLSFDEDWIAFKNANFYVLDITNIENVARQYFNDPLHIKELKIQIAHFWLKKINSTKIDLI